MSPGARGAPGAAMGLSRPPGEGPHPAALLVGDVASGDAEALVAAGIAVARPELPALDVDGPVLAALAEAARALAGDPDLDPTRIAALGAGEGALLVYLLACRGDALAAVVLRGGPVIRSELDAARPVQPLEMTLNLSAPVLGLFHEGDSTAPPEHVELLREALSRGHKQFDIVSLPGPPDSAADTARAAMTAFLREWLELEP